MNRPTTRTEQIPDSASKGVSSRLILAEAAGFVETGEIFVAGFIQGSSGRLASPGALAAATSKEMISFTPDCRRVCVLTEAYQILVRRRILCMTRCANESSASATQERKATADFSSLHASE